MNSPSFAGLELLDTPVLIAHADGKPNLPIPPVKTCWPLAARAVAYTLFELLQDSPALRQALATALQHNSSYIEHDLNCARRMASSRCISPCRSPH
jgi:two-component system nitrogen regulation sensor histidine kinase GlnL